MNLKRTAQVVAALPPLALGVVLFINNIDPPWVTVSSAPLRAAIAAVTSLVAALAALVAWIGYVAAQRISASFFKESVIAIKIISIGLSLLVGSAGFLIVLMLYVFVQLGPI